MPKMFSSGLSTLLALLDERNEVVLEDCILMISYICNAKMDRVYAPCNTGALNVFSFKSFPAVHAESLLFRVSVENFQTQYWQHSNSLTTHCHL
jgi:hypothetical protein